MNRSFLATKIQDPDDNVGECQLHDTQTYHSCGSCRRYQLCTKVSYINLVVAVFGDGIDLRCFGWIIRT